MTLLRQKMIDLMTFRHYSPKVIKRSILIKPSEPGKTCLCPSCQQGIMQSVYRIASFKERRWKLQLENDQIAA